MATTMREPTFWILTALASQPRYGYSVMQQVAQLSGGAVTLQAGTLYAALDRLTAEGLVELDRDEIVDGRTRRYYRLTSDGAEALGVETERLRRSLEAATSQLAARQRFGLGPAAALRAAW
ncbi:PadR family transcriptional regulator [Catellatospora sichuanensis]|uniref:PadR family transcriptional regulator n=1 Tax=Catellatospora sichuanensis TaxID=1969805 RepID=UPI001642DCDB|nr:PadR family transcriptional regulator [Catellatospora sichuanensis]